MIRSRTHISPRDRADGRRVAPATIAAARRLFEIAGLSKSEIGRRLGVDRTSVGKFARNGGWTPPARAPGAAVESLRARIDREIARANDVAEIALAAGDPAAERAARTLGSLVKTLRELASFDERQARLAESAPCPSEEDAARGDSADFADLDAFRDELAARIERLRGKTGEPGAQ